MLAWKQNITLRLFLGFLRAKGLLRGISQNINYSPKYAYFKESHSLILDNFRESDIIYV